MFGSNVDRSPGSVHRRCSPQITASTGPLIAVGNGPRPLLRPAGQVFDVFKDHMRLGSNTAPTDGLLCQKDIIAAIVYSWLLPGDCAFMVFEGFARPGNLCSAKPAWGDDHDDIRIFDDTERRLRTAGFAERRRRTVRTVSERAGVRTRGTRRRGPSVHRVVSVLPGHVLRLLGTTTAPLGAGVRGAAGTTPRTARGVHGHAAGGSAPHPRDPLRGVRGSQCPDRRLAGDTQLRAALAATIQTRAGLQSGLRLAGRWSCPN